MFGEEDRIETAVTVARSPWGRRRTCRGGFTRGGRRRPGRTPVSGRPRSRCAGSLRRRGSSGRGRHLQLESVAQPSVPGGLQARVRVRFGVPEQERSCRWNGAYESGVWMNIDVVSWAHAPAVPRVAIACRASRSVPSGRHFEVVLDHLALLLVDAHARPPAEPLAGFGGVAVGCRGCCPTPRRCRRSAATSRIRSPPRARSPLPGLRTHAVRACRAGDGLCRLSPLRVNSRGVWSRR